ncbi:hypothetical protein D3C86_1486700 [compost metagenome]
MNLQHRGDQVRVAAGITHPPARHRKSLGKAADQNGPVLHARQGSETDMSAAIRQLGINFIRNHDEIMFLHNLGDRLPILTAHNRSCRIAGITENEDFGTRSNLGFQPLGGKLEVVLPECLNAYGNPSAYCSNRRVGNIAGLRNKNFISGRD